MYCMFNVKTKKVYVGNTTKHYIKRFNQHWRDYQTETSRKCYKYMCGIGGFELWMIIPLKKITDENIKIELIENKWIHHFRNYTINDPIIWARKPITCLERKGADTRTSMLRRVQNRQDAVVRYKKSANLVLHTKLWKDWPVFSLVQLLCHIKLGKLEKFKRQQINNIIRHHLKQKHQVIINERYICKLTSTRDIDKKQLKKLLINIIKTNAPYSIFAKYVGLHLDIVGSAEKTLASMISNKKRIIAEVDGPPKCKCHELPLNKINGHIHMKASQLNEDFQPLKELLMMSKKNPVWFSEKIHLEKQFSAVKKFLKKINIHSKWKDDINEQLFQLFHRTDVSMLDTRLEMSHVINTIRKFKEHLVFVELDKNSNTWGIMCQQLYLQEVYKHFDDKVHYQLIKTPLEVVKSTIKHKYQIQQLHMKLKGRRTWNIEIASLLPKNKDIM
ncbi:MAG: hypothetical protein ACREA8_09225 [Nitrosotalea sp.]